MAKHTLKILRCLRRKIFKVCLAILQHYALKGLTHDISNLDVLIQKKMLFWEHENMFMISISLPEHNYGQVMDHGKLMKML